MTTTAYTENLTFAGGEPQGFSFSTGQKLSTINAFRISNNSPYVMIVRFGIGAATWALNPGEINVWAYTQNQGDLSFSFPNQPGIPETGFVLIEASDNGSEDFPGSYPATLQLTSVTLNGAVTISGPVAISSVAGNVSIQEGQVNIGSETTFVLTPGQSIAKTYLIPAGAIVNAITLHALAAANYGAKIVIQGLNSGYIYYAGQPCANDFFNPDTDHLRAIIPFPGQIEVGVVVTYSNPGATVSQGFNGILIKGFEGTVPFFLSEAPPITSAELALAATGGGASAILLPNRSDAGFLYELFSVDLDLLLQTGNGLLATLANGAGNYVVGAQGHATGSTTVTGGFCQPVHATYPKGLVIGTSAVAMNIANGGGIGQYTGYGTAVATLGYRFFQGGSVA